MPGICTRFRLQPVVAGLGTHLTTLLAKHLAIRVATLLGIAGCLTMAAGLDSPAMAQARKKKEKQLPSPVSEHSAGTESSSQGDAELDELAANENALNSLQPGKFSMGVLVPVGGALTGTSAFGMRYLVSSTFALTPFLQFGNDKAAKKTALGITLKAQEFLTPGNRAVPYAFFQVSAGKNGGEGNEGNTDTQAGAAIGLGVEVFIIREISTSVEAGLGYNFMPTQRAQVSTATSQLALHYHFGF